MLWELRTFISNEIKQTSSWIALWVEARVVRLQYLYKCIKLTKENLFDVKWWMSFYCFFSAFRFFFLNNSRERENETHFYFHYGHWASYVIFTLKFSLLSRQDGLEKLVLLDILPFLVLASVKCSWWLFIAETEAETIHPAYYIVLLLI